MKTEIIIANLSCGGCVNTITKKVGALEGVSSINVNLENDTVSIEHGENVSREDLTAALKKLGYPEATDENGLLTKIQSKISCAMGKVS